jgi:dystonin
MRSPRARLLWDKWRNVWLLAWDRQKRLHDHLMYLQELERVRQFSWDDWRKRVSQIILIIIQHQFYLFTHIIRGMEE